MRYHPAAHGVLRLLLDLKGEDHVIIELLFIYI